MTARACRWIVVCLVLWVATPAASPGLQAQETARHQVASPTTEVTVTVDAGTTLTYSVDFRGEPLIAPSPISMTLEGGRVLGAGARVEGVSTRIHDEVLRPVVRVKHEAIRDHFHELTVDLGDHDLVVRAYDDAVAYRFRTRLDGDVVVAGEQVTFAFAADHRVYYPLEEGFVSHNERSYQLRRLSSLSESDLASLPALVDVEDGPKVLITESDLRDYPGLWLTGTGGTSLRGTLPAVVLEEHMANDRDSVVDRRADFLARTRGTRSFPWRVLVIARRDADLLEDTTVFKLAGELELEDPSWIRPGKVAWDWYNANNLFGVDFRAGVNTATYEHFIDFAAEHGIEYVILDEGWYVLGDLTAATPEMDVPHLFDHAREQGVSLIPWVVWKTLDDQLDEALDQFERWGAAGIKVDFMQRDDQWMVETYERIARAAAEHRLLVDFHGAYKPAGLDRRYPNVITREGVKGLEHNKWSADVTPEHTVTLPFIRMVAGPIDFTPGAMVNAQEGNFNAVFARPMSQGTRCHQLAMFVVYDSPLQMLADSPSQYRREPEAMEFLGPVPSVWDRTIALDAEVGDYVLVARRSGEAWYVAAMTDWDSRELDVDLGFLPAGPYLMEVWRDGPNADRYASDFARETRSVTRADRLRVALAPGGGWVARLTEEPAGAVGGGEDVAALHTLADFPVGVAVPAGDWRNTIVTSPERRAIVARHFDSVTAENVMKPAYLHPEEGRYRFEVADALVDFAHRNGQIVHGHTLIWHKQVPEWMDDFEGDWQAMFDDHVTTVASHFAGSVASWDVVNEAFEDDTPTTWRDTIWYHNLGAGYVERAFRLAHAADPEADLYYNDYDISGALGPGKLDRILELVDDFLARGVPIHGVGFQVHVDTETPSIADVRGAFAKVVERGLKVRISELDVSVNPSESHTELTPELAERQRRRYREIVAAYVDVVPPEQRGGITVWGILDGDSWIPGFRQRRDWPLLFDDVCQPKPAFHGFVTGLAHSGSG